MKLHQMLDDFKNDYATPAAIADVCLTVSFVIPVFNSEQSIGHCVASILKQDRLDLVREIILVNDGSSDKSLAVIRNIKRQFSNVNFICVDNEERRYAAYARNRGIERATADLICFIDSDILLPTDYVAKHVAQQQGTRGISFSLRANIRTAKDALFPVKSAVGDFRADLLGNNIELGGASFQFSETHTLAELCLTCAVTYWRADLLRVKGCPENFIGWGFNDTAMAAKVISLGRPVMPITEAGVFHLEHDPRSGKTAKKWAEFARNKKRYLAMLELPAVTTFEYRVEALES